MYHNLVKFTIMQDLVPEGEKKILIGTLIALNIQPGLLFMQSRPELFWSVIISMHFRKN